MHGMCLPSPTIAVSHEEKEEEGATPQLSPLRCRGQWDHGAGNRYGSAAGGGQSEGANGGRRPTGREGQVKREGAPPTSSCPTQYHCPPESNIFILLSWIHWSLTNTESMTSRTIYRRSKLNLFLDDGRVLEAQSLNQIWIQYRPSLLLSTVNVKSADVIAFNL